MAVSTPGFPYLLDSPQNQAGALLAARASALGVPAGWWRRAVGGNGCRPRPPAAMLVRPAECVAWASGERGPVLCEQEARRAVARWCCPG